MRKPLQSRLYLSPPHMGKEEFRLVREAFDSNWIAPLGPQVDAFEAEFARKIGVGHAVALSSGTAALHLALHVLRLRPSDEVFCSTLTFVASANPIVYEGARPVFIDSDRKSWNMDPKLLEAELHRCKKKGSIPRAVICVDLYGQCADLPLIRSICDRYGTILIEDAAEALGATCGKSAAGSFGWANIFSFNGNKIITTSGGWMLATNDKKLADVARNLSQQARDLAPHYEHSRTGYNYRMSNILAAIGRGQLRSLDKKVAARRRNFEWYRQLLGGTAGISFMPEASYGRSSRWLTCILIDPAVFGTDTETVRLRLQAGNIEARPIWKPMHLQPLFSKCRYVGGDVAEDLFQNGLCLPSGSNLSFADATRVAQIILTTPRLGSNRKQLGRISVKAAC